MRGSVPTRLWLGLGVISAGMAASFILLRRHEARPLEFSLICGRLAQDQDQAWTERGRGADIDEVYAMPAKMMAAGTLQPSERCTVKAARVERGSTKVSRL